MKKANGITLNNEDYEIIPPAPSDEGRGGITKEEYDKYNGVLGDVSQLKEDINNKANTSDVYTKTETDNKIISKVAEIVAGAPEDFDTLKEMSDWIASHENSAAEMNSAIQTLKTGMVSKVDTTSIPSLTQEEYDALTEKTALYYFIKE